MSTSTSLSSVLFGKTRRAVLGMLLSHPGESFHLRQIARNSRCALGAVQRELSALASSGILRRERRGNQVLFAANPNCPIHGDLRSIMLKTSGLIDVLRDALSGLAPRIRWAVVFGSMARGEPQAESDVDLLIVSDSLDLASLVPAIKPAEAILSREINPILYRGDEFASRLRRGHHFLKRVLGGPRLMVLGDNDELERLAQEWMASTAQPQRRRG